MIHKNMAESQKHYAELKKPLHKKYIYCMNLYVVLDQAKLTYVEIIRRVAFWKEVGVELELTGNGHEETLKDDENTVYLNRDVGTCQISQNYTVKIYGFN